MSVPMQNSFLDGIMGAVSSPYSSGTGSGTLNFLTGLNTSTLAGSGASGVSGLLSSFGAIGAGVGMVANLIPGLDDFLNNGFDFTCIGGQAYDKGNLDSDLNEVKVLTDSLNPSDMASVGAVMSGIGWRIPQSEIEIGRYKSGCSKSLRQKYLDACKGILAELEAKYQFTKTPNNGQTSGVSYTWYTYQVSGLKGSASSPTTVIPTITPEQFQTEYVPQIKAYAIQHGLNETEAIQTAYERLFPASGGWGGSGGVVLNEDGTIDWNVEAGNNRSNSMLYVLLAGGALLAWKVLKK